MQSDSNLSMFEDAVSEMMDDNSSITTLVTIEDDSSDDQQQHEQQNQRGGDETGEDGRTGIGATESYESVGSSTIVQGNQGSGGSSNGGSAFENGMEQTSASKPQDDDDDDGLNSSITSILTFGTTGDDGEEENATIPGFTSPIHPPRCMSLLSTTSLKGSFLYNSSLPVMEQQQQQGGGGGGEGNNDSTRNNHGSLIPPLSVGATPAKTAPLNKATNILLQDTPRTSNLRTSPPPPSLNNNNNNNSNNNEKRKSEIDELIEQLDQVESEYNAKLHPLQQSIHQKDAIISALGTQLADANDSNTHLQTNLQELQHQNQESLNTIHELQLRCDNLLKQQESSTILHNADMERQKIQTLEAVELARQDIKKEAEDQFQKANGVYCRLKRDYENIREECRTEKKRRTEIQEENDKLKRSEAQAYLEVGKVKAELAVLLAQEAERAHAHSQKTQSLQEQIQQLQNQLASSQNECTAAHMSLANIVAEKERILVENKELNSVCEELMSIVESHETKTRDDGAGGSSDDGMHS